MLTETFYVCLITTLSGVLLKIVSILYKSKCQRCYCFGIEIIRDVVVENDYDEQELEKRTELNKTNSEKL